MTTRPKTLRQRKFFSELATASSFSEAARSAGYSEKSARVSAHKNITKYNDFFLSLFQESEIDIASLASNLKKGLKSRDENIRFRYTKLSLDLIERVLQKTDDEHSKPSQIDMDESLSEEEERELDAALAEFRIDFPLNHD